MMKMYKYIFLLLATILFSVSCQESFLDRPPLDQISTDSYWKTPNDLENYVLQYYPSLPSHSGYASLRADFNSDNMIRSETSNVLNGEREVPRGNWINDWNQIRSVNIFFDNYQKVEGDESTYNHYVGEAHFFRAWFYYDLVTKYGDVPWYDHALQPGSEELMNSRDPRTMIVDNILADLDNAILKLGTRSQVGNTRLNKEAALAFKTRVALNEGTWQKYHSGTAFGTSGADPDKYFQACVDAAEELMNGSEYTRGLYSDYYELFGLDDMGTVDEVLFYKASNSADGMGHDVQFHLTNRTYNMGVTWELVSSYLGKDGEPFDYLELSQTQKGNEFLTQIAEDCDPRLSATVWIPGDLYVASSNEYFNKPYIDKGGDDLCPTGFQFKKMSNPYSSGAGKPFGNYSQTGYIYFRYGEVLLNYAEAKYELDGTVAYDALNLLRQRVDMPDFTVNPQSADPNHIDYGYDISDELYEIRRERRVELALEGTREDDFKRWAAHDLFYQKRPLGYPFDPEEFPSFNPPLNEDGLIDYHKDILPNGYQFRSDQDYLQGIPQDELTLNPNLDQNPGWGE